jgi:hypothetical protein
MNNLAQPCSRMKPITETYRRSVDSPTRQV